MTLRNAFENLAVESKQDTQITNQGTDGAAPPVITGTGIRGWLRGIYEKVSGTLAVSAASLPLPTGAASETTLAAIKAKTDNIPASPSQEHSTAASPGSVRLSDGGSYIGSTAQRLHIDDGGSSVSVDDNGGSLSVDDGGGSVTVDGTVAISNPTANPETGLAKDATLTGRLPAALDVDGGLKAHVQNSVTIANPTTNPETGLAKDATLTASVGAAADAEATANGSAIAILKRLRTLLGGGLPAALVGGRLDVNVGNAPSVAQSGSPWGVNPTAETAGVGVGAAADAAATGNGSLIGVAKQLRALLAGGLPAALTAAGNLKAAINEANTQANALYIRARQLVTYVATYRLAKSTAGQVSLTFTFSANTEKQLATIYHTAGSTKTVRIRKIAIVVSTGAAGVFGFEVRRLSAATAPATGNPAITPAALDPADGAAEAACLALPTTAGSDAAADSPVTEHVEWNAAAAAAMANPGGLADEVIILYEYRCEEETKPLTMRAGTAEGYAIVGRCTQAVALRYTVSIDFTEE